ncbi:NUDIX hydrolase [Candidatus Bathyarchaeota archaeon]|nr:NUDIX hydrolase [Candidatus Bathyarchaeota archaeon]
MKREYPLQPLIGVSVLIVNENKLLLVKRRNEPGKNLWSIPGGLVELGEPVKKAAKREAEEETGLKIKIKKLLDVMDVIIKGSNNKLRFHYVLIVFSAHPIEGELKLSKEHWAIKWVSFKKAENYNLTKTCRKLLRKFKRELNS